MECLDCQILKDCRRLGLLERMAAVDKGGDVELEARTSRTEVWQVVKSAKAVGCKRVDLFSAAATVLGAERLGKFGTFKFRLI